MTEDRIARRLRIARALGNRTKPVAAPTFVAIGMDPLVPLLSKYVPTLHLSFSPFIDAAPRVPDIVRHLSGELTRQRPDGPYFLGGHCFGGLVALELARALVADGREVRWLCLFETNYPGPLASRLHRPRQLLYALSRPAPFATEAARELHARLTRAPSSRRPAGAELFTPWARRAVRGHRPGPYAGPTSMVFAEASTLRMLPRAGWRGLLPEEVPIHVFPGDHLGFLETDAVARYVAARVR